MDGSLLSPVGPRGVCGCDVLYRCYLLALLMAPPLLGVAQLMPEKPPVTAVQALEHVTLFVRDQDQALAWYVDMLGLVKVDDRRFGANERSVTVGVAGSRETHIVLAIPNEALEQSVGPSPDTGPCRSRNREPLRLRTDVLGDSLPAIQISELVAWTDCVHRTRNGL